MNRVVPGYCGFCSEWVEYPEQTIRSPPLIEFTLPAVSDIAS
jgi:hypothetical protein